MQVRRFGDLNRRMLDTWARIYSRQVKKGDAFDCHMPLISLWILEGDYFRDGRWIHAFKTIDRSSGRELCEDFLIVTIELRPAGNRIEGEANQWLYLLSMSQEIDTEAIPGFLRIPAIREAIDIMGAFTKREAERDLYERRLEYQRSESCIRREDYYKGLLVGKAEGELRKAREMARALLAEGIPEAVILKTTGLLAREFEALRPR
jgi:predicted transposase/invertase (TIGR01784 family)